jgi:hypothetical protein
LPVNFPSIQSQINPVPIIPSLSLKCILILFSRLCPGLRVPIVQISSAPMCYIACPFSPPQLYYRVLQCQKVKAYSVEWQVEYDVPLPRVDRSDTAIIMPWPVTYRHYYALTGNIAVSSITTCCGKYSVL